MNSSLSNLEFYKLYGYLPNERIEDLIYFEEDCFELYSKIHDAQTDKLFELS